MERYARSLIAGSLGPELQALLTKTMPADLLKLFPKGTARAIMVPKDSLSIAIIRPNEARECGVCLSMPAWLRRLV